MSNDTIPQEILEKINKDFEQLEKKRNIVIELQQRIEFSTSNVVNIRQKIEELQKQIEESQKALDTEEQHQEELKKEMATIWQQLCNKVNEPEPEPEPESRSLLSDDEAAIRIQKIFQCFQIKILRSKVLSLDEKDLLQEDTQRSLWFVYNFRTGEKRKCKDLLYNISMHGRRLIINGLNKTIYNSEKVVCIIPGCNELIHPSEKKNHLKTVHNIYNRPNS